MDTEHLFLFLGGCSCQHGGCERLLALNVHGWLSLTEQKQRRIYTLMLETCTVGLFSNFISVQLVLLVCPSQGEDPWDPLVSRSFLSFTFVQCFSTGSFSFRCLAVFEIHHGPQFLWEVGMVGQELVLTHV